MVCDRRPRAEFSFEKKSNNVRWAVKDMRLDYRSRSTTTMPYWRAFKNQYGRRCISSIAAACSTSSFWEGSYDSRK